MFPLLTFDMPPWLPTLRDALDLEWPHAPRVAALATVDENQRPRARSIVVREIDDAGLLHAVTDGRSDKTTQLRQTPFAELVFWLPTQRQQFRIAGRISVTTLVDNAPVVQRLWQSLTDASRALFYWPNPGHPLKTTAVDFPPAVPVTTPVPESFQILTLHPDHVDHLHLSPMPHRRTRYREQSAWQPEPINP